MLNDASFPSPKIVNADNPRYMVLPFVQGLSTYYYAFDRTTDQYIGFAYLDEVLAQEKVNELNRLKSPH